MMEQARGSAEHALHGLQQGFAKFPAASRNETEMNRRDRARSQLIAAEIALGHHEAALELLEGWRAELPDRKPNRRAGGPLAMNLAGCYARLGKGDTAIELLREFAPSAGPWGMTFAKTRHSLRCAGDPRFDALCNQAEAWAALQPDPSHDP